MLHGLVVVHVVELGVFDVVQEGLHILQLGVDLELLLCRLNHQCLDRVVGSHQAQELVQYLLVFQVHECELDGLVVTLVQVGHILRHLVCPHLLQEWFGGVLAIQEDANYILLDVEFVVAERAQVVQLNEGL